MHPLYIDYRNVPVSKMAGNMSHMLVIVNKAKCYYRSKQGKEDGAS